MSASIKPNHKAIQTYYRTMEEYHAGQITHEGATETAFQRLLAETARPHGWMLVPKLSSNAAARRSSPTARSATSSTSTAATGKPKTPTTTCGVEIRKKIAKGYPLTNTIFEDTRRAVLFQNGAETARRST